MARTKKQRQEHKITRRNVGRSVERNKQVPILHSGGVMLRSGRQSKFDAGEEGGGGGEEERVLLPS